MKKITCLSLSIILLLGCISCTADTFGISIVSRSAGTGTLPDSGDSSPDITCVEPVYWSMEIVEVYENSALVINAEGNDGPGLSRMSFQDQAVYRAGEHGALSSDALKPGMVVEVIGGPVAESYPAKFEAGAVGIVDDGSDLIGLYRSVIHDMWEVDPALNSGIGILGFDFSNTCLLHQEQEALEYLTAQDFGLEYVTGTWDELADQGYIDRETLYWEDGLFISIAVTGEPGSSGFTFNAQKWRSGLGAIMYDDCSAKKGTDGTWSYSVGRFGIA